MDRQQVITFLDALARGVDQTSGGPLTLGAVQSEQSVAVLQAASALLKEDGRRRGKFVAAGTPWTKDEDERLTQEFDSGRTMAQMALQHGRTSSAITLRLVKLGRIDPAAVKRRERSVGLQ